MLLERKEYLEKVKNDKVNGIQCLNLSTSKK